MLQAVPPGEKAQWRAIIGLMNDEVIADHEILLRFLGIVQSQ